MVVPACSLTAHARRAGLAAPRPGALLLALAVLPLVLSGCRTQLPENPRPGAVPTGQFVHYLRYGESLEEIANRYGRTPDAIIAANNMKAPYSVYEGYQLIIPALRGLTTPSFPRPRPAGVVRTPPPTLSNAQTAPAPVPRRIDSSLSEDIITIERLSSGLAPSLEEYAEVSDGAMARTGRSGFIWPLQGRLARRFRDTADEVYHGIAILAPVGARVRASRVGVVYATGELIDGYGNMVLIKHAGDYLSIYANLRDILVSKDQSIQAGDIIATVGQDIPNPSSPHLHYQLRLRNQAVDPMAYLPAP